MADDKIDYFKNRFNVASDDIYKIVCKKYSTNKAHEKRLYYYISNGWFKFSTPILLTATSKKALPISCFLSHVDDTIEGLLDHNTEVGRITIRGGGISGDWSCVRPINKISPGPIGFMSVVDSMIISYRHESRRGSYAAYLDISHPTLPEFLKMRIPSGDLNRKNLNLHHAINITDDFMAAVLEDKMWQFIDPNTKQITASTSARLLWQEILETRYRTGEPYLNFIDTVRKSFPVYLAAQGYKINCSNLCNEIHLPTELGMTAICCLSSLNLVYYDSWKNTTLVGDLIEMLDNVIEVFLQEAPSGFFASKKGAKLFRPLGLGVLGLAQLYQLRMIPFESEAARSLNREIFSFIKQQAREKTTFLAQERGEPPALAGRGIRNSHLLAIAPTANSITSLRTSPSIEPWPANAFTTRSLVGSALVKNPVLEELLKTKQKNTETVWKDIIINHGSVQHLDFLTALEKEVFKTAYELDQTELIKQASDRQKFICQGQSLSLFLDKNVEKKLMHQLHFDAWKSGCKGLYYVRTKASHRVEKITECTSCSS